VRLIVRVKLKKSIDFRRRWNYRFDFVLVIYVLLPSGNGTVDVWPDAISEDLSGLSAVVKNDYTHAAWPSHE
jgi:hypothetical protein